MADVVAQLEPGVIDPDREGQVERNPPHVLAVAREGREQALDGQAELVVGGRRPLEDEHRSHVELLHVPFEVQEGGIERAQALHDPSLSRHG